MAIKRPPRASPAASPEGAADASLPADTPPAPDPSSPALAAILAEVAATGSHTRVWGELRRKLFPGPAGWSGLQIWCAQNAIACSLNYGSSSRTAEVQFIRRRAAEAP